MQHDTTIDSVGLTMASVTIVEGFRSDSPTKNNPNLKIIGVANNVCTSSCITPKVTAKPGKANSLARSKRHVEVGI